MTVTHGTLGCAYLFVVQAELACQLGNETIVCGAFSIGAQPGEKRWDEGSALDLGKQPHCGNALAGLQSFGDDALFCRRRQRRPGTEARGRHLAVEGKGMLGGCAIGLLR